MEYLTKFCFTMDSNTKKLARLTAGFLILEIFDRFTMKKDSKLPHDLTVYQYSAHDSTIATVLNALQMYDVREIYSYQIFKIDSLLIIKLIKLIVASSSAGLCFVCTV